MSKTLNIPKSTFATLENIYDEIFSIHFREVKKDDLDHKKGREVNAKISFHDNDCYLYCKEIFDRDSMLVEYYYDWYAGNGQILQKFHAHYHPTEAPEDVKIFDPWHFHVPKSRGDKDGIRVAGIVGYSLHDVLQKEILKYIRLTKLSSK